MGLFSSWRMPGVAPDEAIRMVAAGTALLDVREKSEWNAGHAPAAIHLPLGQLAPTDRRLANKARVIVVCRSGNRSRQATATLRKQGIDALNLRGGMRAWADCGGALVDRSNRPGRVI